MEKSLDVKLAQLREDPNADVFIIADAKDADMAHGIKAPGKSPEYYHGESKLRSLDDYRNQIREVIKQGVVDIVLMSASTNEKLTIEERLFDNSPLTPAARANDTTDIHVARHGVYPTEPSLPFRTATIDHIQCGRVECSDDERTTGANLGLYSMTFNNILKQDLAAITEYKAFREEAERKGFRHFLEIFDPNAGVDLPPDQIGAFVNDLIVRTLAGVTRRGMPLFLKMVYHGPKFTEELCSYSRDIVVGILGGGAGTTYDAFKLIAEAQKYGARVALFGRKINNAEHQLAFIEFLRMITDGVISPEEAVRAYHGVLQRMQIHPHLPLEQDMELRTQVMSYGGGKSTVTVSNPLTTGSGGHKITGTKSGTAKPSGLGFTEPDWDLMTPQEKIEYNQKRRNSIYGV